MMNKYFFYLLTFSPTTFPGTVCDGAKNPPEIRLLYAIKQIRIWRAARGVSGWVGTGEGRQREAELAALATLTPPGGVKINDGKGV